MKKFSVLLAATIVFSSILGSTDSSAAFEKKAIQPPVKKTTATKKEDEKSIQKTLPDNSSNHSNKHSFSPSFHMASPSFEIQKPNGLVFFKDEYHLFYSQNPLSEESQKPHCAHVVSKDLIHWKQMPESLLPSEPYDKDGVLSGSPIVKDELLYLLYTGQVENTAESNEENKEETKSSRHQSQNLASSKDGFYFGKSANNPVIPMPPAYGALQFSKKDFTDPFVWEKSERFYAIVGTKYEKTNDGTILLFKSKDLRNWVFINIVALGKNGEMGNMWKSPSFAHIGNDDVLIFSTKGIKPQGKKYLNPHQSGWIIGSLDYNTGNFKQKSPFGIFDHGFDFYAPQVIKTPDGRTVVIGFLGMPETPMAEKSEKWAGMMSLPREIKIINNKVITSPISELKNLRGEKTSLNGKLTDSETEPTKTLSPSYEIDAKVDLSQAKTFSMKIQASDVNETVLSYDKTTKTLKLNRDKSGQGLKGEREIQIPLKTENGEELLKLNIFVDKSSIEIFVNDGAAALSTRTYPEKTSNGLKVSATGTAVLKVFDVYKLEN